MEILKTTWRVEISWRASSRREIKSFTKSNSFFCFCLLVLANACNSYEQQQQQLAISSSSCEQQQSWAAAAAAAAAIRTCTY